MTHPKPLYTSFLVRVWREEDQHAASAGAWVGQIEAIPEGDLFYCTSLENLLETIRNLLKEREQGTS
jgi:hypothetical protein